MQKLASLDAWKRGRETARAAFRLTLDPPLKRHYTLASQIQRAAVSIPANIAEGYALGTTAQFVRHLRIALGSATELSAHLDLARDLGLAPGDDAIRARELSERTIALLVGLLKSLGARPAGTLPASRYPLPD